MRKTVVLVVLGSMAVVWMASRSRDEAPERAPDKLVADRIWIDHLPRDERDAVQAFIVLTESSTGLFAASSVWRGSYEAFRYEASGGELRVYYPQTDEREVLHTTARPCHELDMDYCLELGGGTRGVKRYYSLEDWDIPPSADPAVAIKQRLAALRDRQR